MGEEIGQSFKILGTAIDTYTEKNYSDHNFKVKLPSIYTPIDHNPATAVGHYISPDFQRGVEIGKPVPKTTLVSSLSSYLSVVTSGLTSLMAGDSDIPSNAILKEDTAAETLFHTNTGVTAEVLTISVPNMPGYHSVYVFEKNDKFFMVRIYDYTSTASTSVRDTIVESLQTP